MGFNGISFEYTDVAGVVSPVFTQRSTGFNALSIEFTSTTPGGQLILNPSGFVGLSIESKPPTPQSFAKFRRK